MRSHPAIAARLFDIKQECIWKHILLGEAKPFGIITDYWRRVEVLFIRVLCAFIFVEHAFCITNHFTFQYQARGTPHIHSLICVSKSDGIDSCTIESDNINDQNKVKHYVKSIVSAKLVSRTDNVDIDCDPNEIASKAAEELNYNWCPSREYFNDIGHPSREPFNPLWKYDRSSDGLFFDHDVQRHYRRIQVANQFHRCCFTCFKYCFKHNQVCRFGFPWVIDECQFEPIIKKDRDKKSRVRIRVLPERNNGYLNATIHSPLLTIAHGGNHDVQYIGNSVGAAEYVASYASKAEEPDKKLMGNIYAKKISYIVESMSAVTDRQRLYAVGSAILGSSPVGSVQACYTLLGLKAVKSSRAVVNVNPLHRKY